MDLKEKRAIAHTIHGNVWEVIEILDTTEITKLISHELEELAELSQRLARSAKEICGERAGPQSVRGLRSS